MVCHVLCSRKRRASLLRAGKRARQAAVVACRATRYTDGVIQSFRYKRLRRFYESGSLSGIQPKHAKRLIMLLVALETSRTIGDMDVPGFRLHGLKGES